MKEILSIEEGKNSRKEKNARGSLYPERPSFGLEERIKKLQELEAGFGDKLKLFDNQKEELIFFEQGLGIELEKLFSLSIAEVDIYPNYFFSEEGIQKGKAILGIDFGDCLSEEDVLKKIFIQKEKFSKESLGEIKKTFARSENYVESEIFNRLFSKIDESGDFKDDLGMAPLKKEIILNESNLREKEKMSRVFKKKLKDLYKNIQNGNKDTSDFKVAQKIILELYLKRTNQFIAELQPKMISLVENKFLKNKEKNVSRYDKFIFGTEEEISDKGEKLQIGNILNQYANLIDDEYTQAELFQEESLEKKGLDKEKFSNRTLEESVFREMVEETFAFYGQKSNYSGNEYDLTKSGPAPDNKWRFVTDPNRNSMAVNSIKKVVLSGTKEKSVKEVVSVLLGHEVEGHFVQALNRSKVPLKIFEKVGGDRSMLFAEGGAMLVQDIVSQEAFGLKVVPGPHYIRAMKKRLEGGNYFDCVKTFYQSAIKIPKIKKEIGKISEKDFKKLVENNLKLAINRTKRLFRGGTDFNSNEAILSSSKDTVYLEQKKLLDQLSAVGLEKYAFVGGMNIDTVISLIKIGFLDPKEIIAPQYHSLKIWEKIKKEYEKS